MQNNRLGKVYLMLILAMIFWGFSFIWYKQALADFKPATIILFRLLISFPLLMSFSLAIKKLKFPEKKDFKYFLLLAFFEPWLYFMAESYGLLYVSSTLASVIIATIPLFTPFAGYFYLNEQVSIKNYAGILISFSGVLLVLYADGMFGSQSFLGVFLLFVAVLAAVGYMVVLHHVSKNYNSLSIVSFQNLIGAFYFLPVFLLNDFSGFHWQALHLIDFLPLLYLALFASTFAFMFYIQGVKRIGVTKASVFVNFIPVVTAVSAFFILNESVGWLKITGIIIAILGLFFSQRKIHSEAEILEQITDR